MLGLNGVVNVAESMQVPSRTLPVIITPERCAKYRHQASTCSRCTQACPFGAVSFSVNHPALDGNACKGCGACASACPTGAIEAATPTDRELAEEIAAKASQNSSIALACKQAGAIPAGSVTMTCLARLDPSLLLLALAKGASEIRLISGECGECALGGIVPHLHNTVATAEALAEAAGVHARISIKVSTPASSAKSVEKGAAVSRRSFLGMFAKGSAGYTANVATALIAIPPQTTDHAAKREAKLPAHLPEKRVRLVDSLRELVARKSGSGGGAALFSIPKLDASRCTGCSMCVDICPTGALAVQENGSVLRITCDSSECVGCNLCADACYLQAVSIYPWSETDFSSGRRVTLLERRKNGDPLASVEDKMSRLLGVSIYRT